MTAHSRTKSHSLSLYKPSYTTFARQMSWYCVSALICRVLFFRVFKDETNERSSNGHDQANQS